MTPKSPLLRAIDLDAFEWLSHQAPQYITAIEQELANGKTPEEMKRLVLQNVGPERAGLAARVEQAARYLAERQNER